MEQINALEQLFPQSARAVSAGSANELGQEQFLKLLVAQLENQDPSQPVENGEFLSQIAQFSMVEGIGGLEKGFATLADTLQRNQVSDAAALLQREVLHDGNSVQLEAGGSPGGQLVLGQSASNVQLRVLDANGATVATSSLGSMSPNNATFAWNGNTLDGSPAAPGQYRFQVTGYVGGVEQSLPLRVYGRVESVSVDAVTRELSLQLTDQASLSLADIYEFR